MQWILTRKVWLLNIRKVDIAHFLKKVDIQGVPKKERHFKYIYKIGNNKYFFMKIKLTTHNYNCSQMSKYEVCILNIH